MLSSKWGLNMYNEQLANSPVPEGFNRIGYWIFDGSTRQLLLDKVCDEYLGLQTNNEWVSENLYLSRLPVRSMERYFRFMDSADFGDLIYDQIEVTQGPYARQHMVINGSVISRGNDGSVAWATGYLSLADSAFSEYLSHEIAGDDYFMWDLFTGQMRFATSFCHLLDYDENVFPTSWNGWCELIHPDDREIIDFQQYVLNSTRYGDSFELCMRLRHINGTYVWAMLRAVVINRDDQGMARTLIGTMSNIDLVQDNFENIKQLLYTDTLTGLKNRTYFQQHMDQWASSPKQPISVIYADVTGLKITNDVLGHADGDILLLTVAEAISSVVTREAEVMRLAGDEFVIIMPRCQTSECLELMTQLQAFMDEHNADSEQMPTFVGFGCATIGEVANDTLHATIERAEVRMQANKDANRVENYAKLKAYLEKRKGRPVSMRDGRRLEYLSPEEREQLKQTKEVGQAPVYDAETAGQALAEVHMTTKS